MPLKEKVQELLGRLRQLASYLSGPRRWWVYAVGAAVFGLVLWAAWHAATPAYVTLYSGDYSAVAEVTKALESKKIPYKLDEGGTRVLVPADQVARARVETLGRGIPRQGSGGYEILEKVPFGLTESDRAVRHRQVLEGELEKTIKALGSVESARVHLGLPKESPFVREKVAPTASVVVTPKPGAEIGPGDARAIANIVAAAVPALTPEKVVVTDDRGRLLRWDGSSESGELARDLERAALNVLTAAYGPGVAVSVRVELDPTTETVTEEQAGAPLTRSRQNVSESWQGSGQPPGGAPGTGSNVPGYFYSPPGGTGQWQKQETTENYEFPVTRRQVTRPAGAVKKITVAAVVPRELDPEEEIRAARLLAAAVGTDIANVSVSGIPHREAESVPPRRIFEGKEGWLVAAAVAALAVLILVVTIVLLRRRSKPAVPETVPVPEPLPETVMPRPRSLVEELSDMVQRDPVAAANALRAWLGESS
ncbi:flagellar M-ring protein FliF [Thermanaeromonas toyohensis ToBE]|uniref:Flagellar M-ring protein FliF n=1 Tax=Thermanaeromonas toyohensis ToBE TaxID=698762 RepID=A0A1W1VTK8_9FIRM|nr:flagellar basal-body MS-ring/collar protein FliF [Thermanaeromonas toyohensis]SMB96570.1 flagellar M-ring protein FliF [Thermanaeromonas toyohensis ToBE]